MNGDTPLHIATQKGHFGIVTSLLKSDANVNLKNKDGKTPGFIAVEKCKIFNQTKKIKINEIQNIEFLTISDRDEIFEELLKHNTDINITNKRGETLLKVALRLGNYSIFFSF